MNYQVLAVSFAIIIISWILLHKLTTSSGRKLPPGPTPLPIIGNLHQLTQTPHRALHRLAAVHGPIMRLKLGAISTTVISSPHLAKQVLQKHDHLFSSRYLSDTLSVLDHHEVSVVFLPVNPKWRSLRKAIASEMFSQARLDATQPIRQRIVQQLVNHLRDSSGKVLDIGFVAFTTMINFLSVTLFSVEFADFGSGLSMEFRDLVMTSFELAGKPNVSDFFPALRFLDLQGLRRHTTSNTIRMLEIIGSLVDQREGSEFIGSATRSTDVLDALLLKKKDYDLSSNEIKHLFLDLFVAGTDTSASAVEWAMTELLRNPSKMAKAQSEVRNVLGQDCLIQESDVPTISYIQAVIQETLRLHPPIPFLVPHKSLADVEIDGFTVPVNSQILVNVWSMGRDSKTWLDPESFEPERFLRSKIKYKGGDFEFIPFGAGRRTCPGLPLAHRSLPVVLASLIQSFDWLLEKGMKPEDIDLRDRFGLSLHKTFPLRAIPIVERLVRS